MVNNSEILTLRIIGEVPSLKNSVRISNHRVYETSDIRLYKSAFNLQVPKALRQNLSDDLHVTIRLFKKDRRKDAVNQTAILFDCLQHTGVIKNDRSITSWQVQSFIDPKDPRAEITVQKLNNDKQTRKGDTQAC